MAAREKRVDDVSPQKAAATRDEHTARDLADVLMLAAGRHRAGEAPVCNEPTRITLLIHAIRAAAGGDCTEGAIRALIHARTLSLTQSRVCPNRRGTLAGRQTSWRHTRAARPRS